MAEYNKKLHVLKNDVVTDIKLYTTVAEVGSPAFHMLDGTSEVYAKLGEVSDVNASPLRVLHSGTTYAVLTQAAVAVPTGSQNFGTVDGTITNFTVPAGVTVLKVAPNDNWTETNAKYVKVTPGKTYSLRYYRNEWYYDYYQDDVREVGIYRDTAEWLFESALVSYYTSAYVTISWSPTINAHATTVTDL